MDNAFKSFMLEDFLFWTIWKDFLSESNSLGSKVISSGITMDLRVIGRFLEVPWQESILALNSLRRFFILVVQYLNISIF